MLSIKIKNTLKKSEPKVKKNCKHSNKQQNSSKKHDVTKHNVTKEELIKILQQYKTFTGASKYFHVSDKSIAKWCKKFNIPYKSKEMKKYIKDISDSGGMVDPSVLEKI